MSKFTKGEWRIGPYYDYGDIIDERGNLIACCEWGENEFMKTDDEYQANAWLIACAPKMYKLMKNTSAYILECAKLYKPFPNELIMYAERMQELLTQIDGEDN